MELGGVPVPTQMPPSDALYFESIPTQNLFSARLIMICLATYGVPEKKRFVGVKSKSSVGLGLRILSM
jgi:hypothetical protein